MSNEYVDVLIVGAGLSGIGAACHLQANCPNRTVMLLEGRDSIGGTWDLFRYPGIRSDSDMYTLGYSFRPWTGEKAIADGPSILEYVKDTAKQYGIDRRIRYNHRVKRAAWSSETATWTVDVEVGEAREPRQYQCNFLFMCSGYYSYEEGYTPSFPGVERFQGKIAHPQKWTPDIDYAGKRVVVIGSGATAVTLVPELAKQAAHVTMLQRSPTYVVSRPAIDPIAIKLREHLTPAAAYEVTRWKNVLLGMFFYNLSRKRPDSMAKLMLSGVRQALGPDYDIATHFTPRYKPWDQRVCLVPDSDLFATISSGRASVVTDHIETFTERGIKLRSGQELEADLIVTATGLNLLVAGGVELSVDGEPVKPSEKLTYKGMMYNEVPNVALATGYTNASWTLKCDLTSEYVCRLLNHMEETGLRQCTPRKSDASMETAPWADFTSSYVQRNIDQFPRQGTKAPWRLYQNYARDLLMLRFGQVVDGVMEFSNPGKVFSRKRGKALLRRAVGWSSRLVAR